MRVGDIRESILSAFDPFAPLTAVGNSHCEGGGREWQANLRLHALSAYKGDLPALLLVTFLAPLDGSLAASAWVLRYGSLLLLVDHLICGAAGAFRVVGYR